VVGKKPIHLMKDDDRKRVPQLKDLHIDIGAKDGDEARSRVRVGDVAVIDAEPVEYPNNRFVSRSMDNRIGCYVALEVARRIAAEGGGPGDVAALAVVQEEVGDFAGARTTSYSLRPDVVVAVDVTRATDVRGGDPEEEGEHKLDSGAAIGRGPTIHPAVFEFLHETAEAEGIPFTVEISTGHTFTDADAVHLSRAGIATGLVSVPTRHIHTPVETVSLEDVEACVRLLIAFAHRLQPGTSFAR
jgi:endoglucanase